MMNLLRVMLGGALGSAARYGVALAAARWLGTRFPWGTLIVNLAGCFLIGLVYGLTDRNTTHAGQRLFFVTGFLGGLTTFSSYSIETMAAAQGSFGAAAANLLANNVAGLGLAALGIWVGTQK